MFSVLLLVLVASFGRNAAVERHSQVIGYELGGSQVTFNLNGFDMEDIENIKCYVRFPDGDVEINPSVTRDGKIAICRLPPKIDAGYVDIDLEITKISYDIVTLAEKVFVDPTPVTNVEVKEDWDTNRLNLNWKPEYFAQFFNVGASFLTQLTVYVADSFEPVFTATQIVQLVGQNSGSANVTLAAPNVERFSNIRYPYYYVLKAVGTQSEVYVSSILFAPTFGINHTLAEGTCSAWIDFAEVPIHEEINPCPPCLCQVELDTNFIQSEYVPQIVKLANGGLSNHVLYYERVPTISGYAQTCSYERTTKILAGKSPAQAGWIHYFSKHTSYVKNYFADIWPYIVCCLQSDSKAYCDSFHEKRPADTGHTYPGPENPCTGWGDPHMVTFESVKYDFMGYGEFWLIRGPEGSEFGVQGRMSPNMIGEKVSMYKAFAVRDRNTTVQIEHRQGTMCVFLNGEELRFSKLPASFPLGNIFLVISSHRVDVRSQSGFSIFVDSRNYTVAGVKYTYFDVYGSAAHYNKGKGFMGIFGNFDDDPENDLTSQDGFVIPPTAENLKNLGLLHHRFGLTWMTNATESYFVYEDDMSWENYTNIDFGPISEYPDPATMSEEVRAICGDSLFCYYEYVGTGSLELASEVARVETEFDDLVEEIGRVIPMCDTLDPPPDGRVQANGHLDGALATYSCNTEYDFISGDRVRTCSASDDVAQWRGEEPVCIWTCTTCLDDMEFVLTHDPSDCTTFFLCSFGDRFLLDCPTSQYFDPDLLYCTSEYQCSDTPGC